jgi:hypothetical protein
MNRRSFLKLPALLPLVKVGMPPGSVEHHFQYESVIGTSMDLVVARRLAAWPRACQSVRDEIERLASILTAGFGQRDLFWNVRTSRGVVSVDLAEVLAA